ncbi:hypothetical protein [Nissabacter sp. SGAir0207]|uniref:hypothetical protein n=1 Tax=Nissabacter sp. SGAir0207 TaxID=2126321 RepID=UPI001F0FC539|nr:hypothetical protein [Nissabacter sp. SGAir0207]
MIFVAMLFTLAITGTLWLCRLIYYRVSVHHRIVWDSEVERECNIWWEKHQSLLAFNEICLMGPSGSHALDWIRLLRREQRMPAVRQEAGGRALRLARTFSADVSEREQQLAYALVLQWQKEHHGPVPPLAGCFWLGSDAAWQAFCSQMSISFPDTLLPASAEPWQGEATLSRIAASLRADEQRHFLVAGCRSCPPTHDSALPAGESAVLWLIGAKGDVVMPRGEVFDASANEALKEVCERAVKQSGLEAAPDDCLLFAHAHLPALAGCSWNINQHHQDNYWGEVGDMEPLVVISLAAILARQQNQPCGWIAPDPQHTFALGIVKPHGKG